MTEPEPLFSDTADEALPLDERLQVLDTAPACDEMVKRTGVLSATELPAASVTVAVMVPFAYVASTFAGRPAVETVVVALAIEVVMFEAVIVA